jgi:hypothetical protein
VAGYAKLFGSLLTSSVWCEDNVTRVVWITMLAAADADGVVEGSVPGFARLANVTVDELRAALAKLSAPDPDSRTLDKEGRRIEAIEGGRQVVNYAKYRQQAQAKEGSRAPYYREYRRRKREQLFEREAGQEG